MKKAILSILICIPLISNAQDTNKCKKDISFTAVQVYDGIIATFERSEANSICAAADTDLEELQVTIEDNILRIRKIPAKRYKNQPKLLISYTSLNLIEGYAKADLDTRNLITTDSLTIILKSGSRFYADCDVKYLKANVVEGSLLKIDGYAIEQQIYSSGKATFSGFELEGDNAEVKATTGGTIKLNIEKSISGSSVTKGYVTYKNSPKVDVNTNTGGKLVASE